MGMPTNHHHHHPHGSGGGDDSRLLLRKCLGIQEQILCKILVSAEVFRALSDEKRGGRLHVIFSNKYFIIWRIMRTYLDHYKRSGNKRNKNRPSNKTLWKQYLLTEFIFQFL